MEPPTPQNEPPESAQWPWSLFTLIAIPLIAALLGAAGTYWFTEYANRLRILNYTVVASASLIPKPDLGRKEFKVFVDGKPVDNLSTVNVYLFNATDQDFDDVLIHIKFSPVDGSTPRLIQASVRLSKNEYEELPPLDQGDLGLYKLYILKVANRSSKPVFRADFVFDGPHSPDVSLQTIKKGIKAEYISLDEVTKKVEWWVWPLTVAMMLVSIVSIIYLYNTIIDIRRLIGNWKQRKRLMKIG